MGPKTGPLGSPGRAVRRGIHRVSGPTGVPKGANFWARKGTQKWSRFGPKWGSKKWHFLEANLGPKRDHFWVPFWDPFVHPKWGSLRGGVPPRGRGPPGVRAGVWESDSEGRLSATLRSSRSAGPVSAAVTTYTRNQMLYLRHRREPAFAVAFAFAFTFAFNTCMHIFTYMYMHDNRHQKRCSQC